MSQDGESNWKEVAYAANVAWETEPQGAEAKTLAFDLQEKIKGVRVQIVDANLDWGAYAINEIEINDNPDAVTNLGEPRKRTLVKHAWKAAVTVPEDMNFVSGPEEYKNINDRNIFVGAERITDTMAGKNDYYQFNWKSPVSVNEVVLYSWFSGQCPTAWKIFVSQDGESNWKEVKSVSNVTWEKKPEGMEVKKVAFELQENIKGVRVQIVNANLIWGKYIISEIEINDNPNAVTDLGKQLLVKHAGAAVVTVSAGMKFLGEPDSYKNVNDENIYVGPERITDTLLDKNDYFQFNWDMPVSINEVVLYSWFNPQCPTAWKVLVSKDGVSGWKEVTSVSNVKWKKNPKELESKTVVFDRQEDIKGVRVQITAANLKWGKYIISEIETNDNPDADVGYGSNGIRNDSGTSPKTGDNMPVVPLMCAVIFSTVGFTVLGLAGRKNRKGRSKYKTGSGSK